MAGFTEKNLEELIREISGHVLETDELLPVQVTGIEYDSRKVQNGRIFVALQGENMDGHRFIPDAIQRGAVAVVGTQKVGPLEVPYIRVSDCRLALAHLSAAFYGYPGKDMVVIGVTGTDGKTTTSNLIYQILSSAGCPTGVISTVNAVIGREVEDTGFHVTTPEAPEVQRYLARMVTAGLTHVVLESTSHGLAQSRVAGCDFNIGVVTNITHEHLDYHGTYEAYLEAKSTLFKMVRDAYRAHPQRPSLAVLNRDDQSYSYLSRLMEEAPQTSYSLHAGNADLWAENIAHTPSGLEFDAVGKDFRVTVRTCLVGDYNVSNCLAALAAAVIGLGISPQDASRGIEELHGIAGRMERIDLGQDFTTLVDFAHTPNALRETLQTARKMASGRVLAVFGSAGLRDRQKRRLMAEISIELADFTFLTAEDPRTENLEDILEEMALAAQAHGGVEGVNFFRIPDRGEAIRRAVAAAQPGDIVLACGKGHEQSMCFDLTEYPWDDRIAVKAALAQRLGIPGPDLPYLPTQK